MGKPTKSIMPSWANPERKQGAATQISFWYECDDDRGPRYLNSPYDTTEGPLEVPAVEILDVIAESELRTVCIYRGTDGEDHEVVLFDNSGTPAEAFDVELDGFLRPFSQLRWWYSCPDCGQEEEYINDLPEPAYMVLELAERHEKRTDAILLGSEGPYEFNLFDNSGNAATASELELRGTPEFNFLRMWYECPDCGQEEWQVVPIEQPATRIIRKIKHSKKHCAALCENADGDIFEVTVFDNSDNAANAKHLSLQMDDSLD